MTGSSTQSRPQHAQALATKRQTAPLSKVICHDDPSTTMDFVVSVLRGVFRLPQARAVERMLHVHHSGAALIGCYPKSLAKRRAERAMALARANGFPLTFTVEHGD